MAFAGCLLLIIGFGLLRSVVPAVELVLAATLGIGVGIGTAGAIPSMVVSQRIATRPALGTGAYAGGIVAGSTLAAAFAVPLAVDGDWRRALAIDLDALAAVTGGVAVARPRRRGAPTARPAGPTAALAKPDRLAADRAVRAPIDPVLRRRRLAPERLRRTRLDAGHRGRADRGVQRRRAPDDHRDAARRRSPRLSTDPAHARRRSSPRSRWP